MKKVTLCLFGALILLSIVSCGESSLQQENDKLQNKIDLLEWQIEELSEKSIIIPYDSLDKYIIPTTFHPELKVNEGGELKTLLQWRKFPNDIKVECRVTSDNAIIGEVPSDGTYRSIKVKYDTPGENMVEGEYLITLPNRKVEIYKWRAYPIVGED